MNQAKNVVAALILIILLFTTGCQNESFSYTLRQDRNDVEKVEICSYDHRNGTRFPLVNLSEEDIDRILEELSVLKCHKFFPLDPVLTYGDVIICITYTNAEMEVLGIYNIGWVTPEGNWNTTLFHFSPEEIRRLIAKYVDHEALASVSEEF